MPPESKALPPQPVPHPVPAPVAPPPPPMIVEEPEHPHELGFLQRPWVQNVLPFLTSLSLHAAVVIVGLTAFKVIQEVRREVVQEQIIVPESSMADNGPPGGVENPGIGGDPTRTAAQDEFPDGSTPDGWAPKPGENSIPEAAGGGEGDSDAVIGLGPGGGFARGKGSGSGTGDASGTGSGDGSGGKLAPFGFPGGGIPGPKGKVFGHGGNARTIAFVCDASGSMMSKMSPLKGELTKAIEGLRAIQSFSVIFFAEQKYVAFEGGALVPATADNKKKAYAWLEDISPHGETNPIPGLEVAFKGKPQLLYLLTDGDFPDNQKVLDRIAQINAGHPTRINTIAFVSSAEEATDSFVKLLSEIADKNGGKFVKVDESSL